MHGRLFTLVSADGDDAIFAWGIEISDSKDKEAVIYRRDPDTREITHGVHDSADAARERYTRLMCVPLVVQYVDYLDEIKTLSALLDNVTTATP